MPDVTHKKNHRFASIFLEKLSIPFIHKMSEIKNLLDIWKGKKKLLTINRIHIIGLNPHMIPIFNAASKDFSIIMIILHVKVFLE